MHPLRQYLLDVDEPIQDFARRVGASRQTLYRILGGSQAPRPALARRIVEATGGAVPFEALYARGERCGEVIGLHQREDAVLLDQGRLKTAIAIAVNHLSPHTGNPSLDEASEIAAEAVVNTYAALSPVTSRRGPDRLRQALRPVLEEILRDYSDASPSALALDQGADLAVQFYHQTLRFRFQS